MERFFELEQISFVEYEKLEKEMLERYGLPHRLEKYQDETYFRVLNQISYDSFDHLLVSLSKDSDILRVLSFPDDNFSIGEARNKFQNDPNYIDYLRGESGNKKRFHVEVRRPHYSYANDSRFHYCNENGLWVLRRIAISTQTFREYELLFHGEKIYFPRTSSIYGIHDKPVQNPP